MKILLIDDEFSSKLDPDRRTNIKKELVEQAIENANLDGPIELERLENTNEWSELKF